MIVKLVPSITLLPMLLMFPLAIVAAAAPPPPSSPVVPLKHNYCRPTCGKLNIPYPFGIGKDCYIHEDFDIECDESVDPPRTILRSIQMEVLDIPLNYSGIFVKGPVITSGCPGRKTGRRVDLGKSPFIFSYRSVFTFVGGCDENASIPEAGGTAFTGCHTTCGRNERQSSGSEEEDNMCSGDYCCRTPIYSNDHLRVFDAIFEEGGGGGCKWAFLVENEWFLSNIKDRRSLEDIGEYVPLLLFWLVDDERKHLKYNENTTICDDGWHINNTTARMRCSCNNVTHQGNPYLGCQDINECEDPKLHSCPGLTKCFNVEGSYKCDSDKVLIAILVIGVVIGALLLFMGTLWLYRLIRKRKNIQLRRKLFERNGGLLLQKQLWPNEGSIEKTKVFSLTEMEKATDRFNVNRILGQGGQGTVYKGMLVDGRIIAVKKSKIVDENKLEEFINEVVILSQINHRNVVKLLGCCLEAEVPLLAYEFIPNGNLFQHLHEPNEEFSLSWEMRLRIAIEVAGALSYLHSAVSVPVYHRDVKSANILLDEKFRAKVSDFGMSRSIAIDQTHLTTHVQGTFGYLDPEYFQSSQFTEKSDVYSFGVVLTELLCGRKPINLTQSQETMTLATHFISSMEKGKLLDVLDAKVKAQCHEAEAAVVANLAKRCLNLNGRNRPTMKEVAMELEGIRFSHKEINGQNNNIEEVTENITHNEINGWDVPSTSFTCSSFDSGR